MDVLIKLGMAVLACVVIAVGTVFGSLFWPRYRLAATVRDSKKSVQELMKSFLQEKYKEEFEVELPIQYGDRYGCRLTAIAYAKETPHVKFEIHTDMYRYNEPFSPDMLTRKVFYENALGAQWGDRLTDFMKRFFLLYPDLFFPHFIEDC